MKLNYLIPDRFGKYNLNTSPSRQNPGGGLGTKAQRAIEAWSSYYEVNVTEHIEECLESELLVVEPYWFRSRGHQKLKNIDVGQAVEAYTSYAAKIKILYSTELSMLEIPAGIRHRIFEASDVVTTPCDWLRDFYEMQSVRSMRLCDPVPSVFYEPNSRKTVSVVAMGRISTDKNTEKILEIFKALKGKPIQKIYIGGAALWGHTDPVDESLERAIHAESDELHYNLTQPQIVEKLAEAGCAVFDTFHDTGSESNLEACMAGVVSFYGSHGLWNERPGVHNLQTVSEFVKAIAEMTQSFTEPPLEEERQKTEQWAIANCSYDQFLKQWKDIFAYARSQSQ